MVAIAVGYTHAFHESADQETKTSWLVSGGLGLPTSLASQTSGRYLGTSLTTGLVHAQGLAGSRAEWFRDVLLFGTVNWGHSFSRATTPTSEAETITTIPRMHLCDGGGCITDDEVRT